MELEQEELQKLNVRSKSNSQYGIFENTDVAEGPAGSTHGSFAFLANAEEVTKDIDDIPKSGEITPADLEEVEIPIVDAVEVSDEPLRALQRDVNHVFREVDESTEYTLLAMCSIAAVLSFSELLGDKETFQKASAWAHDLSKDFISNTLKTVWDLFNKEIPQKTNLATLRNPSELKVLIQHLITLRTTNGSPPKLRMRKLYQKFSTLHMFFTLVDVHIFPNFTPVHKEGFRTR